ncbi:MAG: RNA polymerase sigma factor [Saprospiraceae bacterium]
MSINISNTEKEIVAYLEQGDRRAIDIAYKNYGRALYGIIIRVVKSSEVAEEVLQDVFIKIWTNAQSYNRSKGRLFTWMSNIARNASIDSIRTARSKREQKTASIENPVYENIGGKEEMNVKDFALQKVINSLDEKHRILIDYTYFQGYSQREIEKELGIPLGTIKSRLRLAINQLREKLNDDQIRNLLVSIVLFLSMSLAHSQGLF